MKRLYIIFSLLFISVLSQAQCIGNCTAVTATLIDSSGQLWTNATVNVNIIAPNGNAGAMQNNGVPLASPVNTTQTNSFGTFTIALDDNSQIFPAGSKWLFIMCPNATIQNCSQLQVTVSGASMNLSTTLSNVLIVPKVNASPTIQRAYSDTEANGGLGSVYWNTVSNTLRGCTNPFCGTWSALGGGGGGGLPPGTVGQGVTYNNLNVGVATNSFIDNLQSGGTGVGMQGPVSIFNSSFQMYGSLCPTSSVALGANAVGFGSGTDCLPYWGNSNGVFPLYTSIWGVTSGTSNAIIVTTNPPITSYGPGGLLVGWCPTINNSGGTITINAGAGVVNLYAGKTITAWTAGILNTNQCALAQWDGVEFQLLDPQINSLTPINPRCDLFPGSTADVKITNCIAALPAAGGIIDTTGFASSSQTIATCPLNLGSGTQSVIMLYSPLTQYHFTCSNASDYGIHVWSGSVIKSDGGNGNSANNAVSANFIADSGSSLKGLITNWPRVATGIESVITLQGIVARSNTGSTITEGLISLSGVFSGTVVRDYSSVLCGGGGGSLYITSPTTGSILITSDLTFINGNFDCGSASGSGHAIEIIDGGATSGIGSINFYGSQAQHSALSEIDINGNGSAQCGALNFNGLHTESASGLVTTPAHITINDCHNITLDNWNASGPVPTAGNLVTVDQVTTNATHDIFIRTSRFLSGSNVVSSSVAGLTGLPFTAQADGAMSIEYWAGLPLYRWYGQFIGSGTSTTNGTIINSGTSQAQPTINITGATTSDVAICSLNASPVATWQTGIQLLPPVVTTNTVTPWLSNPTAGNITPAATVLRCAIYR